MKILPSNFKSQICIFLTVSVLSLLKLQAQDYFISFAGSGASTIVESVKVENITQGTELSLSGNDVLHLVAIISGIAQTGDSPQNKVIFSPNPVKSNTRMQFFLPASGETTIAIYDISGRKIFQKHDKLIHGEHVYKLEGVDKGLFFVRISSGKYSLSGRLISNESYDGTMKMTYENTTIAEKKTNELKGSESEIEMQYNPDDRIVYTANGGECISLVSDVATSSKKITFDFQPCKDGDGNKYPIVKIGTQTWMAANLKTTKYNNGDPVTLITGNAAWEALRYEGAYCWYENDEPTFKNIFGALYNFWVVSRGDLCPTGWHVPTYEEYASLENYLIANGYNWNNETYGNRIGKSIASTAMISVTTLPSVPFIKWDFYSSEGYVGNTDHAIKRNATGFSALPAGGRIGSDGSFYALNHYGKWWSSSSVDSGYGKYIATDYSSESFGGAGSLFKTYGLSVRCMKNY